MNYFHIRQNQPQNAAKCPLPPRFSMALPPNGVGFEKHGSSSWRLSNMSNSSAVVNHNHAFRNSVKSVALKAHVLLLVIGWALLRYVDSEVLAVLLFAPSVVAVCIGWSYEILEAFRTGESLTDTVPGKTFVTRSGSPFLFWLFVSVQTMIVIACPVVCFLLVRGYLAG